jgi:hypothetical protein
VPGTPRIAGNPRQSAASGRPPSLSEAPANRPLLPHRLLAPHPGGLEPPIHADLQGLFVRHPVTSWRPTRRSRWHGPSPSQGSPACLHRLARMRNAGPRRSLWRRRSNAESARIHAHRRRYRRIKALVPEPRAADRRSWTTSETKKPRVMQGFSTRVSHGTREPATAWTTSSRSTTAMRLISADFQGFR